MKILKCLACGTYTLKEACPKCAGRTGAVLPARYSPQDPYGKYRRMFKDQIQNG
jgi:H/ACA ribonucleoprotein complex subunit 3